MSEENSRGAGVARAKRPVLIAAITVAALVLAGAGVWGAITIRDNRLTNEAQGYLEAVWAQEQLTQAALSSHLEQFEDAQASLQALQPSEEMLQARSEEHTSELQSRGHLVCRLLLEKKKNTSISTPHRITMGK